MGEGLVPLLQEGMEEGLVPLLQEGMGEGLVPLLQEGLGEVKSTAITLYFINLRKLNYICGWSVFLVIIAVVEPVEFTRQYPSLSHNTTGR